MPGRSLFDEDNSRVIVARASAGGYQRPNTNVRYGALDVASLAPTALFWPPFR